MWAIAHEIRSCLAQAKLPEPFAKTLTTALTNRIAQVLDGRKPLYAEGETGEPMLAFKLNKDGLLLPEGQAWMSQHVALTLEALFSEALV